MMRLVKLINRLRQNSIFRLCCLLIFVFLLTVLIKAIQQSSFSQYIFGNMYIGFFNPFMQ